MRASLLLAFGLSLSVPVHAQLTRTFAKVPMVVLTSAVVRHRNHLPVCTATAVAVSTSMPLLDLSAPSTPIWGTNARKSNGAYATLWSGDDVRNNTISYTGQDNDRDEILMRIGGTIPTSTVIGYYLEDTNMDGVVKYTGGLNDRDLILLNIGGSVPTSVRVGQIP